MYVGTENNSDYAEVWEYNGSAWEQVAADGFVPDSKNTSVLSMAVYADELYAGTHNATLGAQVWKYNGTPPWSDVTIGGGYVVENGTDETVELLIPPVVTAQ